jgi:hypothetical protein
MTEPRLSAEQRRALAMLDASLIAGLVNRGLTTLTAEKVRAGGKLIAVAKARSTEAGLEALPAGD